MKNLDLFISHASEDKDDFVRPLAEILVKFHIHVWYDEYSLSIGDSLSRSIDKGLSDSNYGLVVISPDFLKKDWTEFELKGLIAKEIGKEKVILPIWHNVSRDQVLKYSPFLADKFALNSTSKSLSEVAYEIISVIRPDLSEKIQRRAAFIFSKGKREIVEMSKIQLGPLKHESLPPNLISRIRLIRAALLGVYTHSMDFWVDGFRRDNHPSKEIQVWEHIASCFLEFCRIHKLNQQQYETVFKILLGYSMSENEEEQKSLAKNLPKGALDSLNNIWYSDLPAYDIEEEFPVVMDIPKEIEELFANQDRESFPFDIPEELVFDIFKNKITSANKTVGDNS